MKAFREVERASDTRPWRDINFLDCEIKCLAVLAFRHHDPVQIISVALHFKACLL